jgi:putative transposase
MARLPRMAVPGLPHLIVQAGHDSQPVFRDAADRRAYREALAQAAATCAVDVHAYALAGRRVLLLATPHTDGALSRMMQRIGRQYTVAFNHRHGRSGTLWDGRYRAAVIEPSGWLLAAMRLVEAEVATGASPATADTEGASSGPHHRGERPDPLITDHPAFWALGNTPFERQAAYGLLSNQPLDSAMRQRMEHAMSHGWALGSERFLAQLAQRLTRPVRPRPAGRPASLLPRSGAAAAEPDANLSPIKSARPPRPR